jgi:hypothetical protein
MILLMTLNIEIQITFFYKKNNSTGILQKIKRIRRY